MKRLLALNLLALVLLLVGAVPAPAQTFFEEVPSVSVRPFFLIAGERFTASDTFETVFGEPVQPLWGAGVQLAGRTGFFVDITVSRFRQTGERAFFLDGEGFPLGIPLTVTLTPIEFSVGGRFRLGSRVIPYAGGGLGSYGYRETSEVDDEPFEARHVGYLALGGVELRLGRLMGVSGDVHYTHVPGIIGTAGLSQQAGETNLGGVAARFRILVGL